MESIKLVSTSASGLDPEMIFSSTKMRAKTDISCLKQKKKNFLKVIL